MPSKKGSKSAPKKHAPTTGKLSVDAPITRRQPLKSVGVRSRGSDESGSQQHQPAQVLLSMLEFADDFARTMRATGLVVEIEDDGARVSLGWNDYLGAVTIELETAFQRYLRDPRKLDALIDRLCRQAEKELPSDHAPRGYGD